MKKQKGFTVLIVLVMLLIGLPLHTVKGSSSKPSCGDFKIISFKGAWQGGRLRAIGEIKNIGSIAAGVQIEVIARDENGVLVASRQFWPNSINNIRPDSSCGIGFTITRDKSAKTLEVKVISVTVWED